MSKQTSERKYLFHWEQLGDLQLGRPNLGNTTRLEVCRLMMFCFRDVVEQRYDHNIPAHYVANERGDRVWHHPSLATAPRLCILSQQLDNYNGPRYNIIHDKNL